MELNVVTCKLKAMMSALRGCSICERWWGDARAHWPFSPWQWLFLSPTMLGLGLDREQKPNQGFPLRDKKREHAHLQARRCSRSGFGWLVVLRRKVGRRTGWLRMLPRLAWLTGTDLSASPTGLNSA